MAIPMLPLITKFPKDNSIHMRVITSLQLPNSGAVNICLKKGNFLWNLFLNDKTPNVRNLNSNLARFEALI